MVQYAVLIYANDSAHSAAATPQELEVHDRHGRELEESGALAAAFARYSRSRRRRRSAVTW